MTSFLLDRLEYIVREGETAGDQHFLLFPQCFSTQLKLHFNFSIAVIIFSSTNALNMVQSKILSLGKN